MPFIQHVVAASARRSAAHVATASPLASPRLANANVVTDTNASPATRATAATTTPPRTKVQNLQAVARCLNRGPKDSNTNKAYNPKEAEYNAFCDAVYPAVAASFRYTVDSDRLYLFLFYQAFREKKSQKGVKKGGTQGFDYADYESVMDK